MSVESVNFPWFLLYPGCQENAVVVCYLEGKFLWTCFPYLLSWCVPRVFLLVQNAGKIERVGERIIGGKKSCDLLGNGVRKLRGTSTDIFTVELKMRLGDQELEEQKGSTVNLFVSLNFVEFHHQGRLEEAYLCNAVQYNIMLDLN